MEEAPPYSHLNMKLNYTDNLKMMRFYFNVVKSLFSFRLSSYPVISVMDKDLERGHYHKIICPSAL